MDRIQVSAPELRCFTELFGAQVLHGELPYEVITPKAFRTSPMRQQESDFLDCEGLRRLCEAAISPLFSCMFWGWVRNRSLHLARESWLAWVQVHSGNPCSQATARTKDAAAKASGLNCGTLLQRNCLPLNFERKVVTVGLLQVVCEKQLLIWHTQAFGPIARMVICNLNTQLERGSPTCLAHVLFN